MLNINGKEAWNKNTITESLLYPSANFDVSPHSIETLQKLRLKEENLLTSNIKNEKTFGL